MCSLRGPGRQLCRSGLVQSPNLLQAWPLADAAPVAFLAPALRGSCQHWQCGCAHERERDVHASHDSRSQKIHHLNTPVKVQEIA